MVEHILMAALGNSLSGDDGVGQAILARFTEEGYPPQVRAINLGSDSLGIIGSYRGEDLIIFLDAINMKGMAPGAVVVMNFSNLSVGVSRSAHQMDPVEGIALAAMTDARLALAEKILIGVQVESTKMGAGLSKEAKDAVRYACEEVRRLIKEKLR